MTRNIKTAVNTTVKPEVRNALAELAKKHNTTMSNALEMVVIGWGKDKQIKSLNDMPNTNDIEEIRERLQNIEDSLRYLRITVANLPCTYQDDRS